MLPITDRESYQLTCLKQGCTITRAMEFPILNTHTKINFEKIISRFCRESKLGPPHPAPTEYTAAAHKPLPLSS